MIVCCKPQAIREILEPCKKEIVAEWRDSRLWRFFLPTEKGAMIEMIFGGAQRRIGEADAL